jgi:hypothetical protein
MALTFTSGTAGRVRDGSSTLAGLNKWSINKTLPMIETPHFEVTADSNGVPWMPVALYGFATATVDMSGFFDIGDNSETSLYIGKTVSLDLYFNKTSAFGYENLAGTVMEISADNDATANRAATFSCKVRLTGTVTPAEAIAP